jgi:hypothetical protein
MRLDETEQQHEWRDAESPIDRCRPGRELGRYEVPASGRIGAAGHAGAARFVAREVSCHEDSGRESEAPEGSVRHIDVISHGLSPTLHAANCAVALFRTAQKMKKEC